MITSAEILKASILIVDDQEAHTSLLEQILSGAGYTSLTITNDPRTVCDLYRKNRYSLIMLDLQMPGMDGFQVMEGLKKIETEGYLPVLVLTAQPNHKLQALKAGARDFVSKPFDLAEVVMRVRNMLEVRLLHEEAEMRTKQAEASERELRDSELSYRRLFEAAKDGILILDVDTGRINDVNPFLLKLLDFTRSEMVGQTVGELSPFKDIELNQAMLERLQKDGYVRYEDLPLETSDGRKIAVEFVSNVYQVGDKKVIQCDVRDITKRKKTEESLSLFRTLMERSPDAIEVIDPATGRFLDVNQTACLRLGYSREEMLALSMPDIVAHEAGPISIHDAMEGIRKTGVRILESRHRRKDGSTFPVEVNVQYIDLDRGYLLAVVRDITGRKQAEEALRKSEERFRSYFDFGQIGMAITSPTKGCIEVNDKLCQILGYERNELLHMTWPEMTHPDDLAEDIGHFNRVLAGECDGYSMNKRFLRKDGKVIETAISVKCMRNANGSIEYFMALVQDITERKRLEKEEQRVGRQMQLLLESAVEGIYGVDMEGKCTFINRAATEILGCKAAYAIGKGMHDLKHHHRKDGSVYPFEECPTYRALHNQESSHVDDEIFWRADGTSFPVEYSSRPIFEDGIVRGAVVTFTDITERKRAEEVLRSASLNADGRQKRKAFVELAVIAVISAFVFYIGNRYDIFGAFFRYVVEKDNEVEMYLDETAGTLAFICLALLVFSYRRWKESQAETISQTQVAKALSLLHGEMETQVQQRTAELVKSNEALHTKMAEGERSAEQIAEQAALLDKAQDAIMVRDLAGKTLFWNKGAERMYGWTHQEVVGRNVQDLLYANPKKFSEINGVVISRGEWYGELQHLTKDRGEITIEARWTLIRDAEGKPKSILAINTDITERKKIEAQFMRAQRMESIGTLAGGIAHDLNNILAPIMMSIDILKLSAKDSQSKTILETIEVSAKRGADIVRQVLSFARGLEGERAEIQPKHLLKDLENIIKDTFPKDIRLQFIIPNDTWTILGDPTQVHQILLNLCVNARDAMPNGGNLKITVENAVLDDQYVAMNIQAKAGRYVTITVSDSGTGMPPGIIDKIFEPFFTTKELNKGTGLGLSTVMAIVKSHEGVVNVYSEPGKGTSFNVYLPAMDISSEARKDQAEEASLPRGNGEMILLVDDEASILVITSQTLQAFGYRVLTATDGAEAVAIYAQHRHEIAVVLTDMMMPIMDGPATIRALTKIDPAVKIIAASGLSANGEMAKVSGIGLKHFLTKPYTAGTLLKTMRTILDEA